MRELYFNEKDKASRLKELRRISWEQIEAESINFKVWMAENIIEARFSESIGAEKYERTEERKAYGDGTYTRSIQLKTGRLKIKIPRAEGMSWTKPLISKFERKSRGFEEMVYQGFVYGMSVRKGREYFKVVFGEDVISEQGISDIFRKYTKEVNDWHARPITEKYKYIFWDGKYVKVRGCRKRKKVVLKVMGIREDGTYEIIDFRVARSESYLNWSEVAQSLYNRGLDCKDTELFILDGAPGLIETLTLIWTDVPRQICKVHHMRNLSKRVKKANRAKIAKDASKIYKAKSLEQAEHRAVKFEEKWEDKEPDGVKVFMQGLEPTLTFYKFGWDKNYSKEDRQELWQLISNTNMLERQIEEDVRRIKPMRSFRNNYSCDRVFYAIAKEFNKHPWRFPFPNRSNSQFPISAQILT